MDSGNSGSMQSSSGGDEEYDSRPESLPAFLNTSSHFSPLSNPHPSLVSHHQNQQTTFFDPSSNFLNPFSQPQPNANPNLLLNLDAVRPRGLRSGPNCTDLGNLPAGSSPSSQTAAVLSPRGLNQGSFASSSPIQSGSVQDNGTRSLAHSDQIGVVKNPKKRTRASRRAPTTVLTTDTSNFRAMVQEFTGIPSPPFSAGSSFSRRLDLFGSGSAIRSSHLEPMGPLYPLRPSAQRVQSTPVPFVTSASPSLLINPIFDAANFASSATNNSTISTSISATTNAFNSNSSNYQLPSESGLPKQAQNMLNMQSQNPALSFSSLLQPPPALHPSLNVPSFGVKAQGTQGSSAMPSLEELGMAPAGHVNANLSRLQNHVTSDGTRLRSIDHRWRNGVGSNDGDQVHDHLRALDGNYGNNNSQRVNSCKLNYSASSSDFHHDKGLDNVTSRAEGTVDSWICPSD